MRTETARSTYRVGLTTISSREDPRNGVENHGFKDKHLNLVLIKVLSLNVNGLRLMIFALSPFGPSIRPNHIILMERGRKFTLCTLEFIL
ncbi:hypothetical protein DM860_017802 [Cuscuta australis]|uniref:Uncharacterized protein n=1 Tax=Cuscuta australis TaxID=267555 RepID=A0A328DQS5_9ASTE|nr:hypothetical protein DM860_017802 [Cuscuta australis]